MIDSNSKCLFRSDWNCSAIEELDEATATPGREERKRGRGGDEGRCGRAFSSCSRSLSPRIIGKIIPKSMFSHTGNRS